MSTRTPKPCSAKDPSICKFHGTPLPKAPKPVRTSVGARQNHGFTNEVNLKTKYSLLPYDSSYTAKFDAVAPNGIPISIKTKSLGGNVELADYFRNAQIHEDFYLIVTFWDGNKDNIVSTYFLKFPAEDWEKLFDPKWDQPIKNLLAQSVPERSYDATWKQNCKELADAYGSEPIIRLRPKRDSKGQCRMQCAINYNTFLALAEKYATKDFEQWAV